MQPEIYVHSGNWESPRISLHLSNLWERRMLETTPMRKSISMQVDGLLKKRGRLRGRE